MEATPPGVAAADAQAGFTPGIASERYPATLRRDTVTGRPAICILALSPIADDPRVRRQGEAFHRAGWNVVAVGLPDARSSRPAWRILTADELPLPPGGSLPAGAITAQREGIRLSRLLPWVWEEQGLASLPPLRRYRLIAAWAVRKARGMVRRGMGRLVRHRYLRFLVRRLPSPGRMQYALRLLATRVRPQVAETIYWSWSQNILDIDACARTVKAGIWLANDWNMLPIAARLAAETAGVYGYDTHEFAAEEYAEKWRWRLWQKPLVCALERRFITGAAVVSAVSGGIAERLDAMYGLKRPTLVIRNTPAYERCAFRPTGAKIHVLYHGIVAIGRGLEAAIDSVALWRPEFDLTIRGPENPGFSDMLRQRIRDAGVEGRVRLVPPVPMTELVREATAFDVGFFALPGHSRHNEFALPNKFFEYLMAGLALCVSDLPEMARLVDRYRLGVLIPSLDPAAIAASVNGLDRDRIDAAKRNALTAAEELCWERESARLVEAYRALLPQTQAAE